MVRFESISQKSRKDKVNYKALQIAMIAGMAMSLTGCVGCTRVSPGYIGIVTTQAGTDKGVSNIPAQTGWVTYNPITQTVLEYPVFVQTVVWTKSEKEGSPTNEEITFSSKESIQVAGDVSLAYSLEAAKVPEFYVKFRNDDLKTFTHGFLRNLAREKFDEASGHFTIDQIVGDNAAFLKEARESLQLALNPIGVHLEQFGFIGAPRPPQEVHDAMIMKVKSTQIALQKENELQQAKAEAAKTVAQAEGAAEAILKTAEAQAEANRKLAASITPTLVQYKQIEKWDGKLPEVTSGGNGLMLQLPVRGQ